MKAKLIVENGITEIILTPETTFEKNLIDDSCSVASKERTFIDVRFEHEFHFGSFNNSRIEIRITQNKTKNG